MSQQPVPVEFIGGDGIGRVHHAVAGVALGQFEDHPAAILGNVTQCRLPVVLAYKARDKRLVSRPSVQLLTAARQTDQRSPSRRTTNE